MEYSDITIIGGGPVGLFASFYAGLRGMSVRIVDSLHELGGQLTALYPEKYVYDMPGFPKILAKDLAAVMVEQGTQYGPELVLMQTAQTLTKTDEGYVIETAKGLKLPTRTVLIAAGAGAFSPTKIGIPREEEFEGKGLHYGVRERAVFEGKRVALVGGGDSAFDWCLSLEPIVSDLKLIHRRDGFRAHEDTIQKVREGRTEFKLWYTVKELHGNGHLQGVTLENVQTKETEQLALDDLIVNVGYKSSLGAIKDWGLTIEKNQIVVDNRFETNLPGVFAVGDVCSFAGKLKLIATGVGEAATAVCYAKTALDPTAKHFPGHSSDRDG
jgi:ferredoxin/flavodoxin---NADP+ reductase